MHPKHIEVRTGERIHACYEIQETAVRKFASSSFSSVVQYAIRLAIKNDVDLRFNEAAALVAETIQAGYAQQAIDNVVVGRANHGC